MTRVHLVRHGRVENPEGVLYGRLPGFALSADGHRSAQAAAEYLCGVTPAIDAVWSSPLQRALESAKPIARAFGHRIESREGLTEAFNRLEGQQVQASLRTLADPRLWRHLWNPVRPSWGEPFVVIARRMIRELRAAHDVYPTGEVVMVSHELPIWTVHRIAVRAPLVHDPRRRRCALSSVTSFDVAGDGTVVERFYAEPGS